MSTSPKTSLVERLVQDRLRSGDLEASAAQLLQLGEHTPGEETVRAAPDGHFGSANGDAGIDHPVLNQHDLTSNGMPRNGVSPNGMSPNGMLAPAAVTQSLIAAPPADAFPDDHAPVATAPIALELRPLMEPAPPAATPFPLPGLAPSALVPPPATALPVSGQPAVAPPREVTPQPAQAQT